MRVSGVNTVMFSVGTTFWVVVQLPLAIFSTFLFGLTLLYYNVMARVGLIQSSESGGGGLFGYLISALTDMAQAVFGILKSLLGIEFTFNPTIFFFITYALVFAIALSQIFTMYIAYKLLRLNPISGKGSGLKHGALLLTIIGYSIPLLNIFPWFMVWAGAVWLKPK